MSQRSRLTRHNGLTRVGPQIQNYRTPVFYLALLFFLLLLLSHPKAVLLLDGAIPPRPSESALRAAQSIPPRPGGGSALILSLFLMPASVADVRVPTRLAVISALFFSPQQRPPLRPDSSSIPLLDPSLPLSVPTPATTFVPHSKKKYAVLANNKNHAIPSHQDSERIETRRSRSVAVAILILGIASCPLPCVNLRIAKNPAAPTWTPRRASQVSLPLQFCSVIPRSLRLPRFRSSSLSACAALRGSYGGVLLVLLSTSDAARCLDS